MSDPTRPLEGLRILLIEDEYVIAMELKRWLQRAGAEVVGPVPSVERALDLIEDDGIDAAVLDVNLGDGRTAYPIADRLIAMGVPHLFATGDIRVSCASRYADQPRRDKPFVEAELVRVVVKLAASSQPPA